MRATFAALALAALALAGHATARADEGETAWRALTAGGHVLMVRHAQTEPGLGDPPGFELADCGTQRNLSASGREQAGAMGREISSRGVAIGEVLSSRWCRCLDTARLAFGRAAPWPPLDSFFGDRRTEPAQTAAVRARVAAWRGPGTLVLVTHHVNIVALTGHAPAPGEGVVLKPDAAKDFTVVGAVRF